MQDLADNALLREYVENDSQEAFATIVARHVNKVYSIALRQTRNSHQAEEITQAVFVILAQKSSRLGRNVILSGWLCRAARLTAMTFIRSEIRRARREQEAHMQNLSNETEFDVWPHIAPLLDVAMARLNEADHHAVVLRFFDGKSFKEIGAALGTSEDAAKMRVNRAVEKLRVIFTKRGIAVSVAGLATAMSANSVQAAPAVLAKSATSIALTKGATASSSTLTLAKGAVKIMAWTKAKTAILVGVSLLLVGGTTAITAEKVASRRGEPWQRKYDPFALAAMAPETKILPALASRPTGTDSWGGSHNKLVGIGVTSTEIVQAAYDATIGRMIFSDPAPGGRYDFISTQSGGQGAALQQAAKNKFGLTARHALIETNVLELTLRSTNVAGLVPNRESVDGYNNRDVKSIACVHAPISTLVMFLENALGTPIVDRTGLTGYFDMYVSWDSLPEGLKNSLLTQMGLELVPGRDKIDYLVVEKAN